MRSVMAMTLVAVGLSVSQAATIKLKDGSTINGRIALIRHGRVDVRTTIGRLKIPIHKVDTMTSQKSLWFAYDPQGTNRHLSSLNYSRGAYEVDMAHGKTLKIKKIEAAWDPSQQDPFRRQWRHELSLYYTARSGNVNSEYAGGGLKSRLEGAMDRLKIYAQAMYSRYNDRENRNEQIAGHDYEWDLDHHNSFYCLTRFEHDEVEGVELRQSYGTGHGHYFVNEYDLKFRTRLGLQYRNDLYEDDTRWEGPALDVGLLHVWRKDLFGKLETEVTYSPTIQQNGGGAQLLHQETNWDLPLTVRSWRIRLGLKNDYNEEPPLNREHLDTQYYARLVFSW